MSLLAKLSTLNCLASKVVKMKKQEEVAEAAAVKEVATEALVEEAAKVAEAEDRIRWL